MRATRLRPSQGGKLASPVHPAPDARLTSGDGRFCLSDENGIIAERPAHEAARILGLSSNGVRRLEGDGFVVHINYGCAGPTPEQTAREVDRYVRMTTERHRILGKIVRVTERTKEGKVLWCGAPWLVDSLAWSTRDGVEYIEARSKTGGCRASDVVVESDPNLIACTNCGHATARGTHCPWCPLPCGCDDANVCTCKRTAEAAG